MEMLVNPVFLVQKAIKMEGWWKLGIYDLPTVLQSFEETVQEWSEDWPEGQGFGSSDGTYLLQDCLNKVGIKTEFDPHLKIVGLSDNIKLEYGSPVFYVSQETIKKVAS